jgi:hypothetical protein
MPLASFNIALSIDLSYDLLLIDLDCKSILNEIPLVASKNNRKESIRHSIEPSYFTHRSTKRHIID